MIVTDIYIISYLPPDSAIRERRKKFHKDQLEYWRGKGLNITVLAQGYTEVDYQSGVTYVHSGSDTILRPGPARNILLDRFFKTNSDFGLFLDDDILLYAGEKYMHNDTFVEKLNAVNADDLNAVGVFRPIYPSQQPFSKMFSENAEMLGSNFHFVRGSNLFGGMMGIKNYPKFGKQPIYFRDRVSDSGVMLAGEDMLFMVDNVKQGLGMYILNNIVVKDLGYDHSTWAKDTEERESNKAELISVYNKEGVGLSNGKLDWSSFFKYNKIPREVFAPLTKTVSLFDD